MRVDDIQTSDDLQQYYRETGQVTDPITPPAKGNKSGQMPAQKRQLAQWLRQHYTGRISAEHYFHADRQWRFDWAIPDAKVAIEYDGIFGGKAHTSVADVMRDQEKHNEAQILGWIVIRTNAKTIKDETALDAIARAVAARQTRPTGENGAG